MAHRRWRLEPVLIDGQWVIELGRSRWVWSAQIVRRKGRTLREAYEHALRDLKDDQREARTRARRWRRASVVKRPDGADILIFQRLLMVLRVENPPSPPAPGESGVVDLMEALKQSVEATRGKGGGVAPRRKSREREYA